MRMANINENMTILLVGSNHRNITQFNCFNTNSITGV